MQPSFGGWRKANMSLSVVISFLAACHDGVLIRRVTDTRLHHEDFGVIVPLPEPLCELIDSFGFFDVFQGSGFNATASFVAYCRSREIDWRYCSLHQPFYHYEWWTGRVVSLPEVTSTAVRDGVSVVEMYDVEHVTYHDETLESLEGSKVKATAYFIAVDGVPWDAPLEPTTMDVDEGDGRNVLNDFDDDDWGRPDLLDATSGSTTPYRSAVHALRLKCSAARIAIPANPTEIVALASKGMDHREAASKAAAELVDANNHLDEVKVRCDLLSGSSSDVPALKDQRDRAIVAEEKGVSTEAKAKSDFSVATQKL